MINELWHGGPKFEDHPDVFPISTDSVLLAYYAKSVGSMRAVDLCCGSGIISILLALRNPRLTITGVEIQPVAAELASRNAALSDVTDRMNVLNADIRRHKEFFKAGEFDLTVSNPPYFVDGRGIKPAEETARAARIEDLCTLEDLCSAASYITRWGGSFTLVHRPDRLVDVFSELIKFGFQPKRIRFVHHDVKSLPCLVLIDSRRGGKPSLNVEAPLILTNEDGSKTDEYKSIYREGGQL